MLFFEQAQARRRRDRADLIEGMAAAAGAPWGGGKAITAFVEALKKED